MARLKGDIENIDLLTSFSTRAGGRVNSLFEGLHFEIIWNGSAIEERITGDLLDGSGHSSVAGPGNHTGFSLGSTGKFNSLVPNLSWVNNEFTLSFWVNFQDSGFSTNLKGIDQNLDFICSKTTSPSTKRKFSTCLSKDSLTTTGLRCYFGIDNSYDAISIRDVRSNFCDTNDNFALTKNPALSHADETNRIYPSETARLGTINLGTWHHIIIRNKLRTHVNDGITDIFVDGKRIHLAIPRYSNLAGERPIKYSSPGSGVLSEELNRLGANIVLDPDYSLFPLISSFPDYVAASPDRLHLSDHYFYQIAKWDRILNDLEIRDLYQGTIFGVYTERKTSISSPPRKKVNEFSRKITSLNIGFNDSISKSQDAFNDSSAIFGSLNSYLGQNIPTSNYGSEFSYDLTSSLQSSILQREIKNINHEKSLSFNDTSHDDMVCIDGTRASARLKIPVFSVERDDNMQYAGRTDSRLARRISTEGYSMFLSSSLSRHGRLAGEYISGTVGANPVVDTGIAGTGFLYYSPSKRCWVEKRYYGETSNGTNTALADLNGAFNSLEINSHVNDDGNGGFLPFKVTLNPFTSNITVNMQQLNVITGTEIQPSRLGIYPDLNFSYSSKIQTTGSNEILGQFTSSPQMGYFFKHKKFLEELGYKNITSPTVAFGAPFSSKYHAYDDETIKMSNFIDAPFLLKKAILKIPVEIQRINESTDDCDFYQKFSPVAYFNFEENLSSPSSVPDLSGRGHIATLINSASSNNSLGPYGNGQGALDVNYNSTLSIETDSMKIDSADDLKYSTSGNSVSLWVKFSNMSGNQIIFFKGDDSGALSDYYLIVNFSTNRLSFRVNSVGLSSYNTDFVGRSVSLFTSHVTLNNWHHIVVTCDGSNTSTAVTDGVRIYIDGVRRDNIDTSGGTFSSPNITSTNLHIGSRGTSQTDDMVGSIASITIWNRNISEEEVLSIFSATTSKKRLSFDWARNVVSRKDMDNYVFFLYRQRRTSKSSNQIDSSDDIDSSARFLIGSGTVCVYNSSSFGLSHVDGFSDIFGVKTPITSSYSPSTSRSLFLNELFTSSSNGVDPITFDAGLEEVSSPIHGPALSINAELTGTSGKEMFIEKFNLEIEIDPAYVMGGYPNNSLMYVTTSKGHLSTSFYSLYSFFIGGFNAVPANSYLSSVSNRLFNWFPQKGRYQNITSSATPPITTQFQHFWFGGTRQPVTVVTSSETEVYSPSSQPPFIKPHFQFIKNEILMTDNLSKQWPSFESFGGTNAYRLGSTSPEFDIEIARLGLSLFNSLDSPFSSPFGLVNDGRGIISSFAEDASPSTSAAFKRTNLMHITASDGETLGQPLGLDLGMFSIGTLTGSSFSDLVSSLTLGYAPVSNKGLSNTYNPYMLLPTDEIVLGLDACVTPPPDVSPYYGKNMHDVIVSGEPRAQQNAFINPILMENIFHYAGNSYMRILPGDAELIFIGDYIRDGSPVSRNRSIESDDITTSIGDEFIHDQIRLSERDSMVGTYASQRFSGDMLDGTRGVSEDVSQSGINTVKKYSQLVSDDEFIS